MEISDDQLKILLECFNDLSGSKIISLPTSSGNEFVTMQEIIRCEGDNNYTMFYMAGKRKLVVSKTLGEYEQMFRGYHFFRVHQSHLVNLRHVKSYTRATNMITLSDGSHVEISRRKKLDFFKLFNF